MVDLKLPRPFIPTDCPLMTRSECPYIREVWRLMLELIGNVIGVDHHETQRDTKNLATVL